MNETQPNAWKTFHLWTVLVTVLAAMSIIANNGLGTIDDYEPSEGTSALTTAIPPTRARRFGWPIVFEWRQIRHSLVLESELPRTSWDHITSMRSDTRWLSAPSPYLEFHTLSFVADLVFGLILVAGCAYSIERFCRHHPESTKIRIATLFVLTSWVAIVLVAEGDSIESRTMLGFVIYWLKSLRVLGLGLLCFAAFDLICRTLDRRKARFT